MDYLLLAGGSALGYQIHDSELMIAKFFRRIFRINVKSHLVELKKYSVAKFYVSLQAFGTQQSDGEGTTVLQSVLNPCCLQRCQEHPAALHKAFTSILNRPLENPHPPALNKH